ARARLRGRLPFRLRRHDRDPAPGWPERPADRTARDPPPPGVPPAQRVLLVRGGHVRAGPGDLPARETVRPGTGWRPGGRPEHVARGPGPPPADPRRRAL